MLHGAGQWIHGWIRAARLRNVLFRTFRWFVEGFLVALGIPFELVTPQKWQKEVGLRFPPVNKGQYDGLSDSERTDEKKRISGLNAKRKRDNKNMMKELAQRIYPHLKVTLDTADALLILHYAQKNQ